MCRIFGFRSLLQSGVHSSLVEADNAIAKQSQNHPDGWGVAYYKMGAPHLVKMDRQAKDCGIFKQVSGVVSSGTVLAHIRLSTVGGGGPLNTHPFQYGPWVFCHNGTLRDFELNKTGLIEEIDPELKTFIFGTTDSEVLFYLFLTVLKKHNLLESFRFDADAVKKCIKTFVDIVVQHTGDLVSEIRDTDKNYMTFVVTNGGFMMGFQGGQPLRVSTHKTKCPESQSCSFYQPTCEAPSKEGSSVQHLLLSSERVQNENVWRPLEFLAYAGVSEDMTYFTGTLADEDPR